MRGGGPCPILFSPFHKCTFGPCLVTSGIRPPCLTYVGRGLARWSQFNNLLLLQVITIWLCVCSRTCNSFTKTFLCVSIFFYWCSFFSDCSLHTSSLSDMQPKHRCRNYFSFCSRFFPQWIIFQCSIDSCYSSSKASTQTLLACTSTTHM